MIFVQNFFCINLHTMAKIMGWWGIVFAMCSIIGSGLALITVEQRSDSLASESDYMEGILEVFHICKIRHNQLVLLLKFKVS